MAQMQKDLLPSEPRHIECFDNSNIQGTNPWLRGFQRRKASKKDYRHFNIKTVEGPDDFASMTELFIVAIRGLLKKSALPQQ
jgi:excinuclease ABC subunit C